jgi:hypothetical protein
MGHGVGIANLLSPGRRPQQTAGFRENEAAGLGPDKVTESTLNLARQAELWCTGSES